MRCFGVYFHLCAGSQSRTGHACLFRSELDYIIIHQKWMPGASPDRLSEYSCKRIVSTPSPTMAGAWLGIITLARAFPEFTQLFDLHYCRKPQRFRAALYR